MKKDSKLVYSTDQGRIKDSDKSAPHGYQGDGVVRIRRETSGRKGSAVTTISGVKGTEAELKALAKKLKRLCGGGGTLKNGIIEIQGEHREKIASALREDGLTVKLAGG